MRQMKEIGASFLRLIGIMDELRAKCPWDKKQTYKTLRKLTIEETYELADAIIENDEQQIKEELGDLLLHIVFYAKIGSENNAFDIKDVIDKLCEKLIFRHPHVFGDTKADDENAVKQNWESIKQKEGRKSVLGGIPNLLPAMVKATRIQEKVKAVGFDWEEKKQVWDKAREELEELEEEVKNGHKEKTEDEFGDVFFSLINAARLYNIDPESALERTNKKFMKRFLYLEKYSIKHNKPLKEMSLKEMDKIWEQAKHKNI